MNAIALPTTGSELLQDIERMLGRGMSPVAVRRELEKRGIRRRRAEKCVALVSRTFSRLELYEGAEGRMRRYRHIGEQTIDDVLTGKITHEQANAVAGLLRALKGLERDATAQLPEGKPALPASTGVVVLTEDEAIAEYQRRRAAQREGMQ